MSHASMGANTILNLLKPDKVLMFAEGLNIFRTPVNASLAGQSLAESQIRKQTGCSVIAIGKKNKMDINPAPSTLMNTLRGRTLRKKVFWKLPAVAVVQQLRSI